MASDIISRKVAEAESGNRVGYPTRHAGDVVTARSVLDSDATRREGGERERVMPGTKKKDESGRTAALTGGGEIAVGAAAFGGVSVSQSLGLSSRRSTGF